MDTRSSDAALQALGAGAIAPGDACCVMGTAGINQVIADRPVMEPANLGYNICYVPQGNYLRLLPTMTNTPNLQWFAREFYSHFHRDGLIIDMRSNNGGNIDSWILTKLMRKAWMTWTQRVGQAPNWNMQYAFRGHMVLLCDEKTASDGEAISEGFRRLGLHSELDGADVVVPGGQRLSIERDAGEYKAKIQDGPWPAFPADLTSIAIALSTQCQGSVLVHEWMFENRLIFTDKLVLMGADIVMCDPHRAIVTGPARLRGERLESPDIRAGMAMLIAALCAEGGSEIGNVRQIDRGYERIDARLRELGGRIERVATEPQPAHA